MDPKCWSESFSSLEIGIGFRGVFFTLFRVSCVFLVFCSGVHNVISKLAAYLPRVAGSWPKPVLLGGSWGAYNSHLYLPMNL